MRMLAALLLALIPAQDESVSAIVDRIEGALGDVQDASFSITSGRRDLWFPIEPAGPVSVKIRRSGDSVMRATFHDGEVVGGDVSFTSIVKGDAALFEVRPHARATGTDAPLHLRARATFTPAAMGDADFLVLPTAYPIRLFLDEPLLHYALAPKRMFGLVPNLEVVARAPQIVLHSRTMIREPVKALGVPLMAAGHLDRRFIIDPKTGRLERFVWRIDLGRGMAGWICSSEVRERDARGLPTRIRVGETNIFRGKLYDRPTFERVVRADAVNAGFEMPAWDDSLVCVDAILKPGSSYSKALGANPDDAGAHAGLAASRVWPGRVTAALLDTHRSSEGDERALEPLAAVARLRPADPDALLNLLAVTRGEAAREALLKGDAPEVALLRARDAFTRGKFEDALRALPARTTETEGAALAIRVAALIRAGKPGEAAPLASGPTWGLLLTEEDRATLATAADRVPDRSLLALARQAVGEQPRLLRVLLERRGVDADVHAEAAVLALTTEDAALAPALAGTPEGALLAGKPREAWALLQKMPPSLVRKETAHRLAVDLAAEAPEEALAAYGWLLKASIPGYLSFDGNGLGALRKAMATASAAYSKPVEIARLIGMDIPNLGTHVLRAYTMMQSGYEEAALAHVRANRVAPEDVLSMARLLQDDGARRFLEAAVEGGVREPAVLLQLAKLTRGPAALALYEQVPTLGSSPRVQDALVCALALGEPERALKIAKAATWVPEMPGEMIGFAEVLARAGAFGKAEALLPAIENAGRRALVLRGRIAEARGDMEGAMRWHGRGARDGSDPLSGLTAADARKALMERLGEDYFVDRLLAAPAEAMTAEQEAEAKKHYAALLSDDIAAREEGAEGLARIGRRAVAVLREGLKSSDEDTRAREQAMLRRIAEPQ